MVFLSCAGPATPSFPGGPRLKVEPTGIDAGQIKTSPPGQGVEYSLTLKNIGDAPLVVQRIQARVVEGCCPPLLEVENRTIPPGKEERIPFTLKMATDMPGPHSFELMIYSNDAVEPVITVPVKADFVNE